MSQNTPPLLLVACISLGTGILFLLSLLMFSWQPQQIKGISLVGAGLCCFGLGEILNHPKEQMMVLSEKQKPAQPLFQRPRNSCAMGNLCGILSFLLFFAGLSSLLYGR